jgi:hypothetical protein
MTHYYYLWREGKEYPNTSCPNAPVPPHFPIPRCDHDEEAHVKQSRHPSTAARAYYCCPYKSVINSSHLWILFDLTLTSFYSYKSRIGADSFSGSMDPRRLIHKFLFSCMIGVSLVRCALSSIGFLRHRIPLQWQMRKRPKQQPITSATVTPHVSNTYDYVNHVFKRPKVLLNFKIWIQIRSYPSSVQCGSLSSVSNFSELIGINLDHTSKR